MGCFGFSLVYIPVELFFMVRLINLSTEPLLSGTSINNWAYKPKKGILACLCESYCCAGAFYLAAALLRALFCIAIRSARAARCSSVKVRSAVLSVKSFLGASNSYATGCPS